MIRVLHIIPSLGPGGAERVVMHLALHADRQNVEVSVVSLYASAGTQIERKLEAGGVTVRFLDKKLGLDLRMVSRLRRVIRDVQPTILHTHLSVLRYVMPAAALLQGIHVVHTVHNVAEKEVDRAGRALHRFAFRRGFVTPVSIAEEVSESLRRTYGVSNVPLIPNGIPIAEYANRRTRARDVMRRGLQVGINEVVVLAVGRLAHAKNHRMLLDSVARVNHRSKLRLRCLIVGSGELETELRMCAARLGITHQVSFLGMRSDVPELLAAADIFAMPSRWEGNPLALMEAMAAGLPTVATAVGGVPGLISNGETGLLTASDDVSTFADFLEVLATNAELRTKLGTLATKAAAKRFGAEQMTRSYEQLYGELARDNQPQQRAVAAHTSL
jgi:glycosyltransferase involved in cell wall biosynthesis